MFKKWRGVILGLVIGLLIGCTFAVAAGNTTTLYNVLMNGVRIVIDGQELHPTDVNGNKVEPMIYNGTTYLPVRAVASALGKAVYWDGPSYTVYLGNMDGKLEYPTTRFTDMTNISGRGYDISSKLTDNYGNTYGSAVKAACFNCEFLLKMQYSHFKGTLFIPSGETRNESNYMTVTADGRLLYTSPTMTKTSAPVEFDINVTGYNDIEIKFNDGKYSYLDLSLADAGFYQ